MQIVPLRFLSNRYKKERSVAFKIHQNLFSAGALPRTPLGELTTLPQTPQLAGERTPLPYLTPFGTDPHWVLAIRPPQNSSQIYAYGQMAGSSSTTAGIHNTFNRQTALRKIRESGTMSLLMVTHHSTNLAQYKATPLMGRMPLEPSQTAVCMQSMYSAAS